MQFVYSISIESVLRNKSAIAMAFKKLKVFQTKFTRREMPLKLSQFGAVLL